MILDGTDEGKARNKAIDIFREKYSDFDAIEVKWLGGRMLAVVKKEDSEMLKSNPPPEGKLPAIITELGANPSTERILPIEWTNQKGELFKITGSFLYVKDSGEIIGKPGKIFPPKKRIYK